MTSEINSRRILNKSNFINSEFTLNLVGVKIKSTIEIVAFIFKTLCKLNKLINVKLTLEINLRPSGGLKRTNLEHLKIKTMNCRLERELLTISSDYNCIINNR